MAPQRRRREVSAACVAAGEVPRGNTRARELPPGPPVRLCREHLPPLGSCAANVSPPANLRPYYPVGSSVELTSAQTLQVPLSLAGTYHAGSLPFALLPTGASYSIEGAVDPDGCPLSHPAAIESPPGLTVTMPDLTSTTSASCWALDAVGGVVEWLGPFDVDDEVVIYVLDSITGDSITCHGQDTGLFVAPSSSLLGLTPGEAHTITVSRHRQREVTIERSGAIAHGLFLDAQTGFLWVELSATDCGP